MFHGSDSMASSIRSARAATTPIGTPPPSALPATRMSGRTPNRSHAQVVPHRAMPVWISSTISSTSRCRQARWTAW